MNNDRKVVPAITKEQTITTISRAKLNEQEVAEIVRNYVGMPNAEVTFEYRGNTCVGVALVDHHVMRCGKEPA